MPCFLCTQIVDEAIGNIEFASEEADSLGLRCIIEKHFWLQVNKTRHLFRWVLSTRIPLFQIPESGSGYVCGACWEQLLLFHNFYLSVEQAHKALQQTVPEDTSPTEVDAPQGPLVKSEQAESVAAAVIHRIRSICKYQ